MKASIQVKNGFMYVVLSYKKNGRWAYKWVATGIKEKGNKKALKDKIAALQEEKKDLETDIKRLEDSDYIAKYVREKYFYSKDGELILRMDK